MSNLAAGIARAQEALHAGRSARIVQRARLRPARDDDAPQMRFALEDALNTADFADCGRLIVVRRLRLRALPPRAGPAVVARALEAAWQAVSGRAVAASHPQAADAPAVYFESRFEARLAWLQRVVMGDDLAAWYWPAALPELAAVSAAGSAQAEAIEAVAEALLQESAAHTVQALQAWPDAAVLQLARLATQAVSRRLLEAITPVGFASEQSDALQAAAEPAMSSVAADVAQRLSAAPLLPEAALRWVVALRLAPCVPAAQLAAQVRSVAVPWRKKMSGSAPSLTPSKPNAVPADAHAATEPPSHRAGKRAAANASPAWAPAPPAAANASAPAAPVWRMESGLDGSERAPARAAPQSARDTLTLPWLADAQATDHGGLLCLLNLLRALGFESWLAQQPAAVRRPFVHALLAHLLDACGAAAGDPQRAWLALSPAEADALSATTFTDRNARCGLQHALRGWRLRLRRALRRHAALDLPAVVQRRAWVAATATHIDAVFPLDEVDLRLRRHGLDSDPGWVPWFGRIVAFHFVAAQHLPQPFRDRHG